MGQRRLRACADAKEGLSVDKGRYRELCAFCRRYDRMRREGEAGAEMIERAARQADAAVAVAILPKRDAGHAF